MIIAQEKFAPFTVMEEEFDLPIFARLFLDHKSDLEDFLARAHHSLITPVLTQVTVERHPCRWDQAFFDQVIHQHLGFANKLLSAGITRIVLGADLDGALQKILSPRHSSLDLDARMAPLLAIYSALSSIFDHVSVILTVEELAPGGFDASDGVQVAKALQRLGLKDIIATSGTKDFLPLYDRRTTKKKQIDHDDFDSGEPALASSQWLINNTDLSVSCLASINNKKTAITLAQDIGLFSLIEKAETNIKYQHILD